MTKHLTNTISVPNWLMSIFVLSILTMFTAGWTKIDSLEKKMIQTEERMSFSKEQINSINCKLDEILNRLRQVEK